MSHDAIQHEVFYPHRPAIVWRALTDPGALGAWLMENDFAPEVGHRFTFRATQAEEWSGVVHCQVIALERERELAFTWSGIPGAPATVVTFTLTPERDGTRLRLVHSGFLARDGGPTIRDLLDSGWGTKLLRTTLPALLDRLANEQPSGETMPTMTAPITTVQFTTIYVSNYDTALDFYCNTLGFEKRMDDSMGPEMRFVVVGPAGENTGIVLFQVAPGSPQASLVGGFSGIVLSSADVEKTGAELAVRGVTFSEPPTRQPWGGVQAQFQDQDGNTLVLHD